MQPSTPLCLFTGRVEEQNGEYVLTIPEQEIDLGTLQPEETYRVGVYASGSASNKTGEPQQDPTAQRVSTPEETRQSATQIQGRDSAQTNSNSGPAETAPDSQPEQPPVSEGEELQVEIESLGEKGDGLAKVGPGYVVFVSDTEIGQQPLVRVTAARENFAFAEVVEE
jgi:predicted RNA-binding protein with TRAM domain